MRRVLAFKWRDDLRVVRGRFCMSLIIRIRSF